MLISQAVDTWFSICPPKHIGRTNTDRVALGLDVITSIALLVIGALAVAAIIPMPAPAAWAILGAGAAYTACVVLRGIKAVYHEFCLTPKKH